jgi:phenylalanyl-tRNA synthetase alpha chain
MPSALEELLQQIESFKQKALEKLSGTSDLKVFETLRLEWFGKKGSLSEFMRQLGSLAPEDRPKVGAAVNQVRDEITQKMDALGQSLESAALLERLKAESVDPTLPGVPLPVAGEHPVRIVQQELVRILERIGFVTEVGPEVEHEWFNFDALNIPAHHPARAAQDTFFLKGKDGILLRTQTSPVQIRTMLGQPPPIRMISPGRVYRADYDATHSPMFHQIEGLFIDKNVDMSHLKGTLKLIMSEFFGLDLEVRLRPSFFPFTEPSAELDTQCVHCRGKGCKVCKNSGWLEVGGCGWWIPKCLKLWGLIPSSGADLPLDWGLSV